MKTLFWIKEELRLNDNPGLSFSLAQDKSPLFVFIFDETKPDSEKWGGASSLWAKRSLELLNKSLNVRGYTLHIASGAPLNILLELQEVHKIETIVWNRSYTPHDIARDTEIKKIFLQKGIKAQTFQGNVLLEPFQVQTQQGKPYQVYTPFSKSYFMQPHLGLDPIAAPSPKNFATQQTYEPEKDPFWAKSFWEYNQPGEDTAQRKWLSFLNQGLSTYRLKEALDAPTSGLSPHLRWGEISVRRLWHDLETQKQTSDEIGTIVQFQKELIWRDFATHLLYHFPQTIQKNMNPKFNAFPWQEKESHFDAWKKGQTGYPIVDAGMRELWKTGLMHNRVRMIVGSFLVKHLLLDWKAGERWFWDTLLDADIASNIMNWQWVAGTGADAAPYFRIFNPILQAEKFDPQAHYIKKWVPELRMLEAEEILSMKHLYEKTNFTYPKPIVDHKSARARALDSYAQL